MLLEFIRCEFKHPFIVGILLFLICLQTLTFHEGFSTNNKSFMSPDKGNVTKSIKTDFINTSNDNNSSTSVKQNQTINEQKIKIVAAGDFGCGPVAQNNIKQIELRNPDIFLVLGDLSYEPSLDCWYNMTRALDSKIKVAIGNHEDDEENAKGGSKELKDSLLEHYNLQNSYYSIDYGNVHFLVLDTQLEFSLNVFKPEEGEDEEDNESNKDTGSNEKPGAKYHVTTLKRSISQK